MRSSFAPPPANPFDQGVYALDEVRASWHKGAPPGVVSRAAMSFDEAARAGDIRGEVAGAFARALAGDSASAVRRLQETLTKRPDFAPAYTALGAILLRERDVLAHADEAAWALTVARRLAPGVPCIERLLATALAASGHFMLALQTARSALSLDEDDVEARLWSALTRLYFGGDISAAQRLVSLPEESELQGRSCAVWLGAVAGHFARGEFHDARMALRRAIAPLKAGPSSEAPLTDLARRWFREIRGYGPGIPMTGERAVRDVGGAQSEYLRTRAALASLREAITSHPTVAQNEGVYALEIDGVLGEMEARTRRGMLEWGARLMVRGFAEAYLPLCAYLEAPPMEVFAAMDIVVLDG